MGLKMKIKAAAVALDKRPYCPSCKLIWGRQSIGRTLKCTQCGKPLTLKSFKPWLSVIGGICVMVLGGLTLAIQQIPVIWIGGFLFGGSLVINGLRKWFKILEIDAEDQKEKQDAPYNDSKTIVFTCGQCSTKFSVERGKGQTTVICPGCNEHRRVMT